MSLASLIDRAPVSAGTKARLYRLGFNLTPAYRGTGGRVTHVADDWSEVRVKVPLSWRTRNYMGTTFGGSIYGAVDPIYAMMLIQSLGDEYTVWDESADIEFERPGTETLYATFEIDDAELADIRETLATDDATHREYGVDVCGADGTVYATVEKVVYVTTDRSKRA